MAELMSADYVLRAVVDDEAAPTKMRCDALRQLEHPPLLLLRRLLVETAKRTKPVPSRLRALAALAYAREVKFRKAEAAVRPKRQQADNDTPNALGI
jgi:hypothetical protein